MTVYILALGLLSYVELIPTRQPYIDSSAPAAPDWPRFPAANAWQVVATAGGAAVTSQRGLLFAHAESKETWWPVQLDGADCAVNVSVFDNDVRLVVRAGNIVALAASAGQAREAHG